MSDPKPPTDNPPTPLAEPSPTPPKRQEDPPQPLPDPLPVDPLKKAEPKAAVTVLEGVKTEAEARLEREKRDLEERLSRAEDENRTLKTVPAPAPLPDPMQRKKKEWLEGGVGFFD